MGRFETELSKKDEKEFKEWFKNAKEEGIIHPEDEGFDYDFRGFWQDMVKNSEDGEGFNAETHFPDTYKKPNHDTFSNESKYATGDLAKYAGSWEGETYTPSEMRYNDVERQDVLFNETEDEKKKKKKKGMKNEN